MKKYFIIIFVLFLLSCSQQEKIFVNFDHLDSLCQDVTIDGKECTIVHIYADAPDYEWTDAGSEGIACIDDVARAAVVYMKSNDAASSAKISKIKGLLNFVLLMQTDDGEFYNFVDSTLTINTDGITSKKDFAFWAARGYWALGEGYAFFKDIDPGYAELLKQAFLKCITPIEEILSSYGEYVTKNGSQYPKWLMLQYGSDATSELILGINSFLKDSPNAELEDAALKLAMGILEMQRTDHPLMNGAIESWPGYWHAWGNSQVQALAELAGILDNPDLEKAVTASADQFLSRLAAGKTISLYEFTKEQINYYPQIAYDIRTTALGLLEVYHLTGNEKYAVLAGLSASWLLGNNVLESAMYDQETGRIYDGIDQKGLNFNSGAESTIEGLYTLLEIQKEPAAYEWINAKPVRSVVSFFENPGPGQVNQFSNSFKILTVGYNPESHTLDMKTELK